MDQERVSFNAMGVQACIAAQASVYKLRACFPSITEVAERLPFLVHVTPESLDLRKGATQTMESVCSFMSGIIYAKCLVMRIRATPGGEAGPSPKTLVHDRPVRLLLAACIAHAANEPRDPDSAAGNTLNILAHYVLAPLSNSPEYLSFLI